jgi:hypothetical protein
MPLKKDEHVVLDGGVLGFRKNLMLTNKRLVFQKGKGWFKLTWKDEEEILLNEIVEVYAHVDSFSSMSVMKLKLRNGKTRDIQFKLKDSEMAGASLGDPNLSIPMKVKSITDRWVNAINRQLKMREE